MILFHDPKIKSKNDILIDEVDHIGGGLRKASEENGRKRFLREMRIRNSKGTMEERLSC